MWYVLIAGLLLGAALFWLVDRQVKEQQRRREVYAARVVAVLQRIERDHA